jgi:hypothetical protein
MDATFERSAVYFRNMPVLLPFPLDTLTHTLSSALAGIHAFSFCSKQISNFCPEYTRIHIYLSSVSRWKTGLCTSRCVRAFSNADGSSQAKRTENDYCQALPCKNISCLLVKSMLYYIYRRGCHSSLANPHQSYRNIIHVATVPSHKLSPIGKNPCRNCPNL